MELYDIIRPIIDISILAYILYSVYEIVVKTQTQQIKIIQILWTLSLFVYKYFSHYSLSIFMYPLTDKTSIIIGINSIIVFPASINSSYKS